MVCSVFGRSLAALCLMVCASLPVVAQGPVQVDLELILAVDVSGSMDGEEQRFQRAGYLEAIAHGDVVKAIRSGQNQRIALSYVEWAGNQQQSVTVPWRIISDATSAKAFVAELAAREVAYLRGTSISSILAFGARHFEASGVRSIRRVIDVSGDGPNNSGPPVIPVRDRVLAEGIVINGLPIMLAPSMSRFGAGGGLDVYYRDCVIGGPGAFVLPLLKSTDWNEAIRRKLVLEIAGLPAVVVRTQMQPDGAQGPGAGPRADCMIGEALRQRWNDR